MRSEEKRQFPLRAGLGVLFLAWTCISLLAAGALPMGTLTYREVEGGTTSTHVITILPEGGSFRVELRTTRGSGIVRQSFLVASDLSTREWTFSDPERRMELAASVQDEKIVLSGSSRGKKIEKRFAVGGPPWNQLFQMGLGPFALSAEKSFQFRSIGTQGPGELKIGKMSVTRKEEAAIESGGREIAAVHLRISLSGLLAMFWHGDYWYRKSDGLFLRYRGKNRSGGPIAVSELVAEGGADGD